ncbi:DUF6169 family protein [Flavihumibacter sediminis]|nr:DUF6169 family protein [Flavihumibacter sediminis]
MFEISFDRDCDHGSDLTEECATNTVRHIICTNIAGKGDTTVFYYVCDNSDQKAHLRNRKFKMWFTGHQKDYLLDSHIENVKLVDPEDENNCYYTSLIISKKHPNFKEYIEEYKKTIQQDFPSKDTLFG